MDAGDYNRNEKEGNLRLGMCGQREVEKEINKFTLGTERCDNIERLCMNKNKIIIFATIIWS